MTEPKGEYKTKTINTMVKYPTSSRQMLINMLFSEVNAITGRIGGFVTIRNYEPTPDYMVKQIVKACFHENWHELHMKFNQAENVINIDSNKTKKWIENMPNSK